MSHHNTTKQFDLLLLAELSKVAGSSYGKERDWSYEVRRREGAWLQANNICWIFFDATNSSVKWIRCAADERNESNK